MKIQTITSRLNNDFSAVLVCEHCGKTQDLMDGYDDHNFHVNVIPKMKCDFCCNDCYGNKPTHTPGPWQVSTTQEDCGLNQKIDQAIKLIENVERFEDLELGSYQQLGKVKELLKTLKIKGTV